MRLRVIQPVPREPGAPVYRSDCPIERPCPWVACKWHLLTTIASDGRIYKSRDFDEHDADSIVEALKAMAETCTLDVADKGGLSDEEVSIATGLDYQSTRDIMSRATNRMRARLMAAMDPKDPYLKLKESR